MPKRHVILALLTGWLLCVQSTVAAEVQALLGFSVERSAAQRALEQRFDNHLNAADMDAWMQRLTAQPHHLGSAAGRDNAEFIAERFREWGYETRIETFNVLFPTPLERKLTLLAPTRYEATLQEDALEQDPATGQRDQVLPPYNAYSVDGDVEADLVFVNYGMPEDYELLERHGVDVRGKIVIAKYGKSWRGIKPKMAAEKGALGCLIYSDPADDGYGQGDVYPEGPFKNDSAVQRGSVMDLPMRTGDPLTPNRGSSEGARRIAVKDVEVFTAIPVLPISYRDAEPLLRALGGSTAPQEWRGALPFAYHLGPGPARVRLTLKFNWQQTPVHNVIATLHGAELPDQWVIRGNHHDGWNHGAADPISGLVALMAEARANGLLARDGQRPRRTLIYAAWDGEEPGLLGSTEWAEQHADDLRKHAVAYLNTDGNSRGFVGIGGSHALEPMLAQTANDLKDPQTGLTLLERVKARVQVKGDDSGKKDGDALTYHIAPLGSGSDYTPFLQHLGIASVNSGFGGEAADGSYHTLYDTYTHYTRFRDPGLVYGVALAQLNGRAALRLANADVLPFDAAAFSDTVARYVDEVIALADKMRSDTEQQNKLIADGSYAAALDATKPLKPPKAQASVPHFNFAPLRNALADFMQASRAFTDANGANTATALPPAKRAQLDRLLASAEQLLIAEQGLPRRPWYRHLIYAPGFYTGYGVKTLPGVREAIEERDYAAVQGEVTRVADALNRYAARVREATALIAAK